MIFLVQLIITLVAVFLIGGVVIVYLEDDDNPAVKMHHGQKGGKRY